ncbi:hypothetical protein EW146_g7905 [Bondarzewia mesenterica]|uniref:Peptidase S54 rhomboid domain-containing protein n=1 Tax=Bondarzewia mesenterica TaxID=1095465 RepID=A0A4S4LKG8_9AGAM|nr:hypothetical protein EW146_g7905 [Bondarzewia mesenterica]
MRSFTFSHNVRFLRFTRSLKDASIPPEKAIPSFREQVARTSPVKSFSETIKYPRIARNILFFLSASGFAYGIAAIDTNITTNIWAEYVPKVSPHVIWSVRDPTTNDMRVVRDAILIKKVQNKVNSISESLSNAPMIVKELVLYTYAKFGEAYITSTEGRRVGWGLCAVNTAVWIAWQIPRLRPFMHLHFTHNPLSGRTYTMLTSMFSHSSLIHLLFNCMALTSFASATSTWMTREQRLAPSQLQEATASYHFLAFFISAGLFSSLVSHVVSARFRFPRMVSQLARSQQPASTTKSTLTSTLVAAAKSPATATTEAGPTIGASLGASGAIYAAVAISALAFPEAQVSLVFPPTGSIPIEYGVGALVLLDIVGALRGWRLFDHFAHLGGAAFGAAYYAYGMRFWDDLRVMFANMLAKPDGKKRERGDKP